MLTVVVAPLLIFLCVEVTAGMTTVLPLPASNSTTNSTSLWTSSPWAPSTAPGTSAPAGDVAHNMSVAAAVIIRSESQAAPDVIEELARAYYALHDITNARKVRRLSSGMTQTALEIFARHLPRHPQFLVGCRDASLFTRSELRHALVLRESTCNASASAPPALPPVQEVWEKLFRRRTFIPEQEYSINALLVAFVNYFHDDGFRSQTNTSSTFLVAPGIGMRLNQVYGNSLERERALRVGARGKMRVSYDRFGQVMPPKLDEIWALQKANATAGARKFSMWNSRVGPSDPLDFSYTASPNMSSYYAMGDPRFNMHPGHILWTALTLKIHNEACDAVVSERPHLSDQEVFEIARLIVFHVIQKVRITDFVQNSISHLRDMLCLEYDPDTLREEFKIFTSSSVPVFAEFNHLYRWHALIPEHLEFSSGERVAFRDAIFAPQLMDKFGVARMAEAFKKARVGKYTAKNTPDYLAHATMRVIQDERTMGMQSFNTYRRHFGMEPLRSFEDFGLDAQTTADFAALYHDDIESVEFFTGIMLDVAKRIPGNFMGNAQLYLVGMFAFQDFYNSDLIRNPALWSEQTLTKAGKAYVKSFYLSDFLTTLFRKEVHCPFSTEEECAPRAEYLSDPLQLGFSVLNFMDGVGLDEYVGWVTRHPYAISLVRIIFTTLFAVSPLFFGCWLLTAYLLNKLQPNLDYSPTQQLEVSVLMVFTVLFAAISVPLSVCVFMIHLSPNVEETLRSLYTLTHVMASAISIVYAIDAVFRCTIFFNFMVFFHHVVTLGLISLYMFAESTYMYKLGLTLISWVPWEFPFYLAFLVRRLYGTKNQPKLWISVGLRICIIIYIGTRIVECVWLAVFLILSGIRVHDLRISIPLFVATVCLSIFLIVMQFAVTVKLFHREKIEEMIEDARRSRLQEDATE